MASSRSATSRILGGCGIVATKAVGARRTPRSGVVLVRREPRVGDESGRPRRIRLRHPGRQQRQRAVELANDQMIDPGVALASEHGDALAAAGVIPIADQNLSRRTPGIMALV